MLLLYTLYTQGHRLRVASSLRRFYAYIYVLYRRIKIEFTLKKKKRKEYTEELLKKGLNDPDDHHGVTTHLEPNILECEVKRALGSLTTNKASGGDEIPAELFQILKDDAIKVLHSIYEQICKTQ